MCTHLFTDTFPGLVVVLMHIFSYTHIYTDMHTLIYNTLDIPHIVLSVHILIRLLGNVSVL